MKEFQCVLFGFNNGIVITKQRFSIFRKNKLGVQTKGGEKQLPLVVSKALPPSIGMPSNTISFPFVTAIKNTFDLIKIVAA